MSSEKDDGALFDELTSDTTAHPEAKAAPAPEATETPEPEVATENAPETVEAPKAFDPNSLPAEARSWIDRERANERKSLEDQLRKIDGEYRALKGKVPGLQRELDLYRKQRTTKPTEAKPADSFFDSADWKGATAEFPELATPIQTLFAQQQAEQKAERDKYEQRIKGLEERLESIAPNVERAAEFTERYEAQQARDGVLKNHPDFSEHLSVGYDPDADEGFIGNVSPQMQEYLDTRAPKARDGAIRGLTSRDPADVDEAMATFKEWRDLKYPQQEGKKPEASARLRASVTPAVKGRGAGSATAAQFDSEGAYFDSL